MWEEVISNGRKMRKTIVNLAVDVVIPWPAEQSNDSLREYVRGGIMWSTSNQNSRSEFAPQVNVLDMISHKKNGHSLITSLARGVKLLRQCC